MMYLSLSSLQIAFIPSGKNLSLLERNGCGADMWIDSFIVPSFFCLFFHFSIRSLATQEESQEPLSRDYTLASCLEMAANTCIQLKTEDTLGVFYWGYCLCPRVFHFFYHTLSLILWPLFLARFSSTSVVFFSSVSLKKLETRRKEDVW